jgi:hypothetical protein
VIVTAIAAGAGAAQAIRAHGAPALAAGSPGDSVSAAPRRPEVQLAFAHEGARTRVVLVAAPNLEINAKVPPALELADGSVLRFTAPALTPDSAYFAAPPVAWIEQPADTLHGTLRVGVCQRGEEVCRRIAIAL